MHILCKTLTISNIRRSNVFSAFFLWDMHFPYFSISLQSWGISREIVPSMTFQNMYHNQYPIKSFQKSRMRIDKSMMIGVMAAFTFLFLCWLATEFQWTESFMRQRELTTKTSMQTSAAKEVRWSIQTFEMKIALCFQENSLKYILAWTTRHGNRVAGKTSYLKCVSKNPRCVWTSDR